MSFTVHDDSGVPATSRIYFAYSGTRYTQSQADTLAGAVAGSWNASIAPLVATTDTLVGTEVQDLSIDIGVVGVSTPSDAGTRSGTALPAGVAVNVGHVISRHYRGGRPKTFLRAGVIGDLASGTTNQWSTSFITAAKAGWQAFVAGIQGTAGANVGNLKNISYYQGFTPVLNPVTGRTRDVPKLRTGGPQLDDITDAIIRPTLGSQRRRLQ